MKAYVTSIGENTTQICCEQLNRFGFEVVLLDGYEPWEQKYKRFIEMADDHCIRIDADVIVNELITFVLMNKNPLFSMVQFLTYDLYRNNIGITSPVFYSKRAIEIIRENFDKLDLRRPEATAWRLPEIVDSTFTQPAVVGMHGFFQRPEDLERAKKNKIDRKQMDEYDFDLAEKLIQL